MTKHLTLLVHRILPILLFIGLAWGQESTDRLILNNKKEYFGEFIEIKGENIVFRETNGVTFQSIPLKTINKLELADGTKSIINGIYLTSRIIEIQEIARADAKQNNTIFDWLLVGMCSGVTGTCSGISMMFLIDDTVPIFIVGGVLGAAIPGTFFNIQKNNRPQHIHNQYPELINTEKDKRVYQNAYNNELKKQRKIDLLKFGTLSSASIYGILIGMSILLGISL